mmetsp:Transcript_70510/g.183817  ORF Transcript_70510/g.183817 Transcript_70510/m.183817 type:complete len:229 (+) Transcript_70510:347-1033(+)
MRLSPASQACGRPPVAAWPAAATAAGVHGACCLRRLASDETEGGELTPVTPPRFLIAPRMARSPSRSCSRRSRLGGASPSARVAACTKFWPQPASASPILGASPRAPSTTCLTVHWLTSSTSVRSSLKTWCTSEPTFFASCLVFCTPATACFDSLSALRAVRPKRSIQPGMRPTPSAWANSFAKSRQFRWIRSYSGPLHVNIIRWSRSSTSCSLNSVSPICTVARYVC